MRGATAHRESWSPAHGLLNSSEGHLPRGFPLQNAHLSRRLHLCSIRTKEQTHWVLGCAAKVWWMGRKWRERVSEGTRRSPSVSVCLWVLYHVVHCSPRGDWGRIGSKKIPSISGGVPTLDSVNGDKFSLPFWIPSRLNLKEGPSPFLTLKLHYKIRMTTFLQAQIMKQEEASALPCPENNTSTHMPRGCCQN